MPRPGTTYPIKSVVAIGNFLPRRCGIATFTTDLCNALAAHLGESGAVKALVMDDVPEGYAYPDQVKFQLRMNVQQDYLQAAHFINVHHYDVAILQHEYGIFGGVDGSFILALAKSLRIPLLTTLHTVLKNPTQNQKDIIIELSKASDCLIVMSHKAEEMLGTVYGIEKGRIAFIPHGIPDIPLKDRGANKAQFGVEGRKVLLTFGLLNPGKGIEVMLQALPDVVQSHPSVIYIVLGATHPHIQKLSGDEYLHSLQQLVNRLGLEKHVVFYPRFVNLDILCDYLKATDIYVTPYLSLEQITSGTLAYSLGAGCPVVSTPYWYAEELLDDGRGCLVPVNDSARLAEAIIKLLDDDKQRNAMRRKAYKFTRSMVWSKVAGDYLALASKVIKRRVREPLPTLVDERIPQLIQELPEPKLQHLRQMTDDTGLLQHAIFAIPNRDHGYCTDDNARALVAASMYYSLSKDESVIPLIQIYLAFLHHAFNRKKERFRNFLSFDRQWQEEVGSADSHARSIWGLGACVKYISHDFIRDMATRLFEEGLNAVEDFQDPRALAFTLVGLHHFLEVYGGDAAARRLRVVLAEKLHRRFVQNMAEDWLWPEDTVTYANGKLPHALLLSGQWISSPEMFDTGLVSLKWLLEQQTAPGGHLSLVGNDGWLMRDGQRANFDQQPLDAMCLVEACAEVFRATGDQIWLQEARRCLGWFLGRNDLNTPLYHFRTGGCYDGLHHHGVNSNQGAESTLAWLISLLTMYEITGMEFLVERRKINVPRQKLKPRQA